MTLLMNRFALRDAGEFTFYNPTTNHALFTLDTVKTAQIDFTGNTVYARGGNGNPKLVGFSSDREGKLQISNALWDPQAVAASTGKGVVTGVRDIDYKEKLVAKAKSITLKHKPKNDVLNAVYILTPDGSNGQEYTAGDGIIENTFKYDTASKKITLPASVADNSVFHVYYTATTDASAKTITVATDSFGSTFKVVGKILVRDAFDGKDYPAVITIDRAKVEDNFSFSLSVDGDPSVHDIPLEMLKSPLDGSMFNLTVFNDSDLV